MLDRLRLDADRLEGIAAAVEAVAALPDPVGEEIRPQHRAERARPRARAHPHRPDRDHLRKPPQRHRRCRRAVRARRQCGAAARRQRGGSIRTARSTRRWPKGWSEAGVPAEAVQLLPTQDRAAVGAMLKAAGLIDMIVPRGGKSLVERVQTDARVPVLAHLDGICHTYIHSAADPEMAREIALNAKMRRTGICGAMETLLLDAQFPGLVRGCRRAARRRLRIARRFARPVARPADQAGQRQRLGHRISRCGAVGRGGRRARRVRWSTSPATARATPTPSSPPTMRRPSASSPRSTAPSSWSTPRSQFADGGEFGLGAEIGIATGRLHARGPVALEGLTTYKWQVRGSGQTRP